MFHGYISNVTDLSLYIHCAFIVTSYKWLQKAPGICILYRSKQPDIYLHSIASKVVPFASNLLLPTFIKLLQWLPQDLRIVVILRHVVVFKTGKSHVVTCVGIMVIASEPLHWYFLTTYDLCADVLSCRRNQLFLVTTKTFMPLWTCIFFIAALLHAS